MQEDLFGDEVKKDMILREKYLEPPFTVLDTKGARWKQRKRIWLSKGIKSEIGRDVKTYAIPIKAYDKSNMEDEYYGAEAQKLNTSIFDPVLCETLYHWFCPPGGKILDCFAGGSVRGIVANFLGFKYTGIEIRPEQVESNVIQGKEICPNCEPYWICGDSDIVLDVLDGSYDFVFSCPPYADLEVYSDMVGDISNLPYREFMRLYESIIRKSCDLLKPGGYACFVVGEVRDKQGNNIGFVPDTIRAFTKCGMKFYNDAILLNNIASASMRADRQFSSGQKLVKIHQNVLVFKKP